MLHRKSNRSPLTQIRLVILAASALLGAGLSGPSMTVSPRFGSLSQVVAMFKPELTAPEQFSLLSAIVELFRGGAGEVFVGTLLAVFSVAFPILKLSVMWLSAQAVEENQPPLRLLRVIETHGKLSMLDIFVMALVVIAVKGLPGGTTVTLNWGVVAFAISILLTLRVPAWIEREYHRLADT